MLLFPVILSLLICFAARIAKSKSSDIKLALINFIVVYLLIVMSVYVYDFYLQYKVSTFDLNGDGVISNTESIPEYLEYSSRLTNDVGRNFAPITGFIFAFSCSVFFYLLLRLRKMGAHKS